MCGMEWTADGNPKQTHEVFIGHTGRVTGLSPVDDACARAWFHMISLLSNIIARKRRLWPSRPPRRREMHACMQLSLN